MNKSTVVYKTSIPMFPIFLVLLILKVTGIINITWFWVFFPLFWIFAFLGFLVGFLGHCGDSGGYPVVSDNLLHEHEPVDFHYIRKSLEVQNYEPVGTVYVGPEGSVNYQIMNVCHATACRVDFVASKAGTIKPERFPTLREALAYIGIK